MGKDHLDRPLAPVVSYYEIATTLFKDTIIMTRRNLSQSAVLLIVGLVLLWPACAQAEKPKLAITNLTAASGKAFRVEPEGFVQGGTQYVDRDYHLEYVPAPLQGQALIQTAGNDKMIDENEPCLSFEVNVPVTVYVVYSDKLRLLPQWLKEYENTRWKVTRKDTNPTTLKGIFSLLAKDFPAGKITLYGNLSKAMAEDAEFRKLKGGTFCMYSVVVAPR